MSALKEAQIQITFSEAHGNPDSWMKSPDAQSNPVSYDSLLEQGL
jgi:hypothetical protein